MWVFFLLFAVAPVEWDSVSSDSVEVLATPQGKVSHLRGNVIIAVGETVLNGSEALLYEAEEKAVVVNVIVHDGKMVLSGDTLTYYRLADRALVKGRTRLKTVDETIHADTLIYLREEKRIEGRGNLTVVSLKEDAFGTGGKGEYDLRAHFGILTDSPVFTVKAKEDITIESESMRIDQEADVASAEGHVRVTMTSANVNCDSLRYDLKNEVAYMWGDPRIEGKNGWVAGDTIISFFRDRELSRTRVIGDASGEYELTDGGANFVRGDTIEIFFDGDEMESILVRGSAEGEYIEGAED
jgi:lipopolysaccharide export system protein LptA